MITIIDFIEFIQLKDKRKYIYYDYYFKNYIGG
jgi:hypothetical protein